MAGQAETAPGLYGVILHAISAAMGSCWGIAAPFESIARVQISAFRGPQHKSQKMFLKIVLGRTYTWIRRQGVLSLLLR